MAVNFEQAVRAHSEGDLQRAEKLYQTLLDADPEQVDVAVNLAVLLKNQGRLAEARSILEELVREHPGLATARNNLGRIEQQTGQLNAAEAHYREALKINPAYPEAWNNLGNLLLQYARVEEAEEALLRALELKPDYVMALNNLGIVCNREGQSSRAESYYRKALEIQPEHLQAQSNLAKLLGETGRSPESMKIYQSLLSNCAAPIIVSNFLNSLHLLPEVSLRDQFLLARQWSKVIGGPSEPPLFPNPADPDRPLRVGYVSGDFGEHPVGYFLGVVLEHHDADAFEIYAYSNSRRDDAVTGRIKNSVAHWRDIFGLEEGAAVERIRQDEIDLLIDLAGHTGGNSMGIFSRRAAPLQLTWLGYFGTTGLAEIDYIIADAVVLPAQHEQYYTEQPLRLADSYLCFEPPQFELDITDPPGERNGYITFGCFNNRAKITAQSIELWAQVLRAVPDSRLLLKCPQLEDPAQRSALLEAFGSAGIAAERLEMRGKTDRRQHLQSYRDVDLALDTVPYGGGTTTAEALWMGVPVITLLGNTWVGRVSASILQAADLPDFVAKSDTEFVDKARTWAAGDAPLSRLRHQLRRNLSASALCDAGKFTGQLEAAYRKAWHSWCQTAGESGQSPADVPTREFFAQLETVLGKQLAGDVRGAELGYREMLEKWPDREEACINLGVLLRGRGELEAARTLFEKAISLNPAVSEAHNGLGRVLQSMQEPRQAVRCYQRAIELDESGFAAYNNLGMVQRELGDLTAARQSFANALERNPQFADALNNLGSLLLQIGEVDAAQEVCLRATRVDGAGADEFSNLGVCLAKLGRVDEALESFRTALLKGPVTAVILSNMGGTHKEKGEYREARACFMRALELDSANTEARSHLIGLSHFLPDFSLREQRSLAEDWFKTLRLRDSIGDFHSGRDSATVPDRLRVGYISGDLKQHPVGFFLSAVLPAQSALGTEIFCYSNNPIEDEVSRELKKSISTWRQIHNCSDSELVDRIRDDELDVLVDLSGHTTLSRLEIFADRCAGVQLSWLGYFGTTGVPAMDYVLADRWVLPEGEEAGFTESIYRLPHSYLCYTPPACQIDVSSPRGEQSGFATKLGTAMSAPPAPHEQNGFTTDTAAATERPASSPPGEQSGPATKLGTAMSAPPAPHEQNGFVTFACFNNRTKLSEHSLNLWAELLLRVPESRLLLKFSQYEAQGVRREMHEFFLHKGLTAERILMQGGSPRAELLQTYNQVDMALDPMPYGGGTTTAEALWMGVPVVTKYGDRWVGRVSASILHTIGLPELVAADEREYLEIATSLAGDSQRLASLRQKIRGLMLASPLCDGAQYAQDMDVAFRTMLARKRGLSRNQ